MSPNILMVLPRHCPLNLKLQQSRAPVKENISLVHELQSNDNKVQNTKHYGSVDWAFCPILGRESGWRA